MAKGKNWGLRFMLWLEEEEFWAFVERTAKEVRGWPKWIRGGDSIIPAGRRPKKGKR